jgi:hypothetical protein
MSLVSMIHAVQTGDMVRAHSPAEVDERLRKPASIGTRSGSSPADPQGTLNFQNSFSGLEREYAISGDSPPDAPGRRGQDTHKLCGVAERGEGAQRQSAVSQV